MSEENRRERERQGTRPASRIASRQVVGISIVAAALAVIAVVAFLALRGAEGGGSGPGSGSGDPTGPWDIALSACGGNELSWGRIDLSQFSEDRLSGSSELMSPDGDIAAFNVEGEVDETQEGGLPVRLSFSDGCQLQGTLDGDNMEGTTVFSGTDSAGSFVAVRAGDVTEDSRREAVRRYLQAWDVGEGTTGEELRESIGENVIAPFYWDSSGGENARELADKLDGEEEIRTDLEMVDYEAAGSGGVMRYRQNYHFGGDEGVFHGATPARVVRWGKSYRVLYAGSEMPDAEAYLGGEYRVTTRNESEYFADPESSDLIFGSEGFVMALDSFSPDGDGSYDIGGAATGMVVGPAEVSGSAYVDEDGELTANLDLEAQRGGGGVADLSLTNIGITDEGLAGDARDESTGAVTLPYADFIAVRE